MSCGAETEANELLISLLAGEDLELPEIDFSSFDIDDSIIENLKAIVGRISNDQLTTTTLDGSGTFDVLMRGFKAHLKEEFDKGRITGAEYTKAYIALTSEAMGQSVQFLLGRDLAFWQSQTAQLGALTALTQAEIAKMQLATARFEAQNSKAAYGLTKMKISSESMAYCTAKYQLDNLLPKQLELTTQQIANLTTEGQVAQYQLDNMLPTQKELVQEQIETQRSQTLDTRTDGIPVTGSVGKQKDLYQQQITSYQRDAETKAGKMWTDAWITMKTIDEGLDPPDAFTNAHLDQVLGVIATNNGFGSMS